MDRDSPYERIRTADAQQREKIYAEIYDGSAAEGETGFQQPHARRRRRLAIYSRIIGPGHEAIVELGCGSGDLTCELAKLAQKVVGIDMSSSSLLTARQRADALLPPAAAARIELAQMNAVQPEFPDQTFDYAVSTSMIEHLHPEDVDIHLREVWRLLKPGGRYLVWCPESSWPSSGPPLPLQHDVLSRPYRAHGSSGLRTHSSHHCSTNRRW